jgi:dynein heavy chain
VKIAEKTERDIDTTRNKYSPVAVRGRILFFCIVELASIDPMYQYSLTWFMNLFRTAIARANKSDDVSERVKNLNEFFTFLLFQNVCRSLFEKHKSLFAFLLTARMMMDDGSIDSQEWAFLVGSIAGKSEGGPPPAEWISIRSWEQIQILSSLPKFQSLVKSLSDPSILNGFKNYFDSANPEKCQLPGNWGTNLSHFQKLLILKCFRPDRLTLAAQYFVANVLGQKFVEPTSTELSVVYKESTPLSPIIFVLSSGADPSNSFYQFAEDMRFTDRLAAISLGQGQGPRAEALLEEAMMKGMWLLLQNCHLSPSWMPNLDRIVDNMSPEKVHRDFRLW